MRYYSAEYSSPLGTIVLASDGSSLVGLWNEGQKYFGSGLPAQMEPNAELPVFTEVKQWLERYFAGEAPALDSLPLTPLGSPFRQQVWALLREIPYGQVTTYSALAGRLAATGGHTRLCYQAVGGAVAHNPISILIPCHRVVGANGSLTGYAGGLAKKIRLLELEGVDTSRFTLPAADSQR